MSNLSANTMKKYKVMSLCLPVCVGVSAGCYKKLISYLFNDPPDNGNDKKALSLHACGNLV